MEAAAALRQESAVYLYHHQSGSDRRYLWSSVEPASDLERPVEWVSCIVIEAVVITPRATAIKVVVIRAGDRDFDQVRSGRKPEKAKSGESASSHGSVVNSLREAAR